MNVKGKKFDRAAAEAEADKACVQVDAFLSHLVAEGLSLPGVLAGAHAAVVSAMVAEYGGQLVAERCEIVADQVRNTPSLAQVRLMAATPKGRA